MGELFIEAMQRRALRCHRPDLDRRPELQRRTLPGNRQRLVRAMEAEGFVNYDQEWWHFSWPLPEGAPAFDVPIQ